MRKWTVISKFYFGELAGQVATPTATTMVVGEVVYESPVSEHNSIWVKNLWYSIDFSSTSWKLNCVDNGDLTQLQADALWPPTTGGTSGYSGFSGTGLSGFSGIGFSGFSGYSGIDATIATIEHDFWPAGAFIPATTGGAGTATFESVTNKVNVDLADFDTGATEEAIYIWGRLTKWNGLTVKVKVHYVFTTISGGTTVEFEVSGRSYGDGDVLDQAMGTAQTCTDTLQDAGDVAVTAASAAITLAGTPANSEIQCFKISRNTSADDGNPDARVIGIEIEYQKSSSPDTAW